MAHAIRIHKTGGPEVLRYDEVAVADPGPGELRLRQTAIGVNFIDTYHRSGLYPVGDLPSSIGMEATGVVTGVGDDVAGFCVGDRVGYPKGDPGAYATQRVVPAEWVVALPDDLDDADAAGILLQGMTVEYLVRRCYEVQPGDVALLHAAAGGVGLIACQWLDHLGATVIGTVSTEEKAELAAAHGCHHTIRYTEESFVDRVKELTDSEGVDVVYDGVGKATLEGSLDSLRRRGTCVVFGNASGAPDPIAPLELSRRGSLYLTRPSLTDYIATREELDDSAAALFAAVSKGAVTPSVEQTWPLEQAAEAHRALERRETVGSIVLLP